MNVLEELETLGAVGNTPPPKTDPVVEILEGQTLGLTEDRCKELYEMSDRALQVLSLVHRAMTELSGIFEQIKESVKPEVSMSEDIPVELEDPEDPPILDFKPGPIPLPQLEAVASAPPTNPFSEEGGKSLLDDVVKSL